MSWSKAPILALLMTAVALAGCSSDGGALGIKVTPADDPVTDAYVFEATGSADSYTWDFGDGTGTHDGKRIEHTFGFTDGVITVRLIGMTGGEAESATTTVTLGSGQNANPVAAMTATTDWITPGQSIRVSGATTTDPDGDPILYRWKCTALGAPVPAHGHTHGTVGGVPFGVNVLATLSGDVPAADRSVDGDLCDGLADSSFSRDGTVEGSLGAVGVYHIDVEIRDPKSPAFVGRLVVFVTDSVPEPTTTVSFEGTLQAGNAGAVQSLMDQVANPTGLDWDIHSESFTVPVPDKTATITFSASSPLPSGDVTYEITAGGGILVAETSEPSVTLGPAQVKNLQNYEVNFRMHSGIQWTYSWTLEIENDLKPTYLWEAPLV